uniref:Uncharacterized protein n=1 Tax=Leersia perrieri TaxID=77586 RepID=A0A0D9W3A2_9ORYZ
MASVGSSKTATNASVSEDSGWLPSLIDEGKLNLMVKEDVLLRQVECYQLDSRPPSVANITRPKQTPMPDGLAINYFDDEEEGKAADVTAVNVEVQANSSKGRKHKALIASDLDDEMANQSAPVPRLSSPPPSTAPKARPFSLCPAKRRSLKVSSIKPSTSFTCKADDIPPQPPTTLVVETPVVMLTDLQSDSAEVVVPEATVSPPPHVAAIDIRPTAAQVTTSSDITPTGIFFKLIQHQPTEIALTTTAAATPATTTEATPSPFPAFITVVDAASADKGKQVQGSLAAAGPTTGSDSERTVSEEKVVQNSSAKDTLLERIAPLAEKAEQAQEELAILRNEVAAYRNICSNFKDKLRDFLGHDPAIFEAKKQAKEQVQKLQAELTQLQSKNQAKKYKDKLKTLMQKHEELRTSNAKETSSMKMKHNNDLDKMKAKLDEARRISAEFCEDAEPILDTLYSATAESNGSSLQVVSELLQPAPTKFKEIILESVGVACSQTLAILKSLCPSINLQPITSRYAEGTTDEKALELTNEVDDIAKVVAKNSLYPEE